MTVRRRRQPASCRAAALSPPGRGHVALLRGSGSVRGGRGSRPDDLHMGACGVDAGAALRIAADCLRRASRPGRRDQVSGTASPQRARHLAAAAAELAAGRDLLHTHIVHRSGRACARKVGMGAGGDVAACDAGTGERDRGMVSRGSPLSRPGSRAWPRPHVSRPLADRAVSCCLRRRSSPARASGCGLPVPLCVRRSTPTRYGQRIPNCCTPSPQPCAAPTAARARPAESVSRTVRRDHHQRVPAARGDARQPGPGRLVAQLTSGGWQWMAQAAAVTSHLGELALRSLATRAGQLTSLPVTKPARGRG